MRLYTFHSLITSPPRFSAWDTAVGITEKGRKKQKSLLALQSSCASYSSLARQSSDEFPAHVPSVLSTIL